MSIRFNASGEQLNRTTNLPPITTFTMMGWFCPMLLRGAAQAFMAFGTGVSNKRYNVGISATNQWSSWNGTTSKSTHTILQQNWYHVAMTVSGVGANLFNIWVDGQLKVFLINAGVGDVTAGKLYIAGNESATEWGNHRVAAVKIWDRALSQKEIQFEMFQAAPKNATSLNAWYHLPSAADYFDYSGQGRNWTVAGTLNTEGDPPLVDHQVNRLRRFQFNTPAGGLVQSHYRWRNDDGGLGAPL